mmetsp:Transcript_32899/g.93292  ORF Transcript_32899/g.93292 Transcript_32899/m.93292 type:complete len:165 (-) Transcript_32899:278-772(-)|eukprot:CAMPEP_0117664924 /NCGR_PEP_ID=MMETSP0804-20121206/9507_1 /TAXON_ID=1074897 /ORGANISM="Tetraselmis astigmatica, Strain CCMP880" /LENGTH=164 /DNA_ID=CAMNT_0005472245 /DNA_START=94 /DNA_END=588 /DNA_ORIENTATION=-
MATMTVASLRPNVRFPLATRPSAPLMAVRRAARPATACVFRTSAIKPVSSGDHEPLLSNGGDGGGFDGGSGRGFGGDSNGGNFGGNGGVAVAAAVPLYDIAAKVDLTAENILLCLACVFLPVLGVYLKRKSLDKYVLASLVLTFLPPLGIIFAIAHCFFNWNPL